MADTIHDVMFGPVLEDRPCGDCVACCRALNIDEPDLVKAEGELCPHCTGSGCAVYAMRPQVCRSWNCAYKRIESMPPDTRPDRMGVLLTVDRHTPPRNLFEMLYIIAVATEDEAALHSGLTGDALNMFTPGPLPIFVSHSGMKTLVHPEPNLAHAILNPLATADKALVRTGRAWLARYAPFARLGGFDDPLLPPAA